MLRLQLMPEEQRISLVQQHVTAFTEFDPVIGQQLEEQVAERRAIEESKKKLLRSRSSAFDRLRVTEKAAKKQVSAVFRQPRIETNKTDREKRKAGALRRRNLLEACKQLRAELQPLRTAMRSLSARQRRIFRRKANRETVINQKVQVFQEAQPITDEIPIPPLELEESTAPAAAVNEEKRESPQCLNHQLSVKSCSHEKRAPGGSCMPRGISTNLDALVSLVIAWDLEEPEPPEGFPREFCERLLLQIRSEVDAPTELNALIAEMQTEESTVVQPRDPPIQVAPDAEPGWEQVEVAADVDSGVIRWANPNLVTHDPEMLNAPSCGQRGVLQRMLTMPRMIRNDARSGTISRVAWFR
ncbi:hypothetical protein MITS9504_00229 [Synechococcus sp. MIT S9504]|nr:hypothetical protein MITS9504_00229 [Synechococcus sp. MIT S9504]